MLIRRLNSWSILLFAISLFRSFVITGQNTGADSQLELSFSHSRNFYNEPFQLILNTGDVKATIVYTLDCSTPNFDNGLNFTDAIFIDSSCVVKAFAYNDIDTTKVITHTFIFPSSVATQGKKPAGFPQIWSGSSIIPADYEMDPEVINNPDYSSEIENALKSVPTVSLSMNINDWFNGSTGIYAGYPNSDVTREKAVTAEFIFENESENFTVQCGVQNQGGTSIVEWKVPKQSMRLLFKEMYGPAKLNYKLFPDSDIKKINTLVLDGFLYSWLHPWDDKQRVTSLYFRDQLASDMQNKMGWPSFHGIYVNLFINGLYWGMYDLHERPDEDFMAEYLDANPEDFDIIKHNPNTVVQGTNASYIEMLSVARNGLSTPERLKNFQKYIDLPAFIDYMILNFYLGNYDWAHQNYYAATNKVTKSGFRFYTWDAEHVMRYSDVNYYNLDKNDKGGPTEIHTLLKQNAEYRIMFADAVYRHFFNDGVLTPESLNESFLFRKNETENAVILESARWGDYRKDISGVTYTKNDFWIPEVNKVLVDYIPRRRNIVLGQMRNENPKLFPENMPPVFVAGSQSSGSEKKIELSNPNKWEGDIYYTLDGSDPRNTGGTVHGLKYTATITLAHSSVIKARFLPKNSGEWSALAEKTIVFDEIYGKEVVINEIMYHPENNYPEFIELLNSSEENIMLDGFVFTKGIEYTFQPGSNLLSGTGIVLTNDTSLFRIVYGFKAYGQYSKRLNNGGEKLILENAYKQIIDSLSYSDTIPWPVLADGEGYSLELINPKADNSVSSNWKVSEIKDGTPFEPQIKPLSQTALYPNPFTDMVSIEIGNPDLIYKTFVVDVYNLFGIKVKSIEKTTDNLKIEIRTHDLSQGVYIFQIRTRDKSDFVTQKFKALKI